MEMLFLIRIGVISSDCYLFPLQLNTLVRETNYILTIQAV